MVSTSSASHLTLDLLWCEPGCTCTSPRYDVRPPPRATDLLMIEDDVCGAACTILAPASWCWPSPAKAIDSTSPWARSPIRYTDGYFIVSFEPRLQSTHSTVASCSATARLVTRLNTLVDQFWTVV